MKIGKRHALAVLVIYVAHSLFCIAPSFAHEPEAVSWTLHKNELTKGRYKIGSNAKGDHQVEVNLAAAYADIAKYKLLVVFPNCQEDPPTLGRPISTG